MKEILLPKTFLFCYDWLSLPPLPPPPPPPHKQIKQKQKKMKKSEKIKISTTK